MHSNITLNAYNNGNSKCYSKHSPISRCFETGWKKKFVNKCRKVSECVHSCFRLYEQLVLQFVESLLPSVRSRTDIFYVILIDLQHLIREVSGQSATPWRMSTFIKLHANETWLLQNNHTHPVCLSDWTDIKLFILPINAGDIRLLELINPVRHSLLSNFPNTYKIGGFML